MGAAFLGGELSLGDGLLALEGKDHIGFGDGNADDTNIDAGDRVAFLADIFEILAGLRLFAIVAWRQIISFAVRWLSCRRGSIWSSRRGSG